MVSDVGAVSGGAVHGCAAPGPGSAEPLPPTDSRERARTLLMGLQDSICTGLQALDGEGRFQEESWVRPGGWRRSLPRDQGRAGCSSREA
jgi:coproporphyrinogen III oxidase